MDWYLFINRKGLSILLSSCIFPGYSSSFIKKTRGLNIGNDCIKVDSLGNVYFSKKEMTISGQRLLNYILKDLQGAERLMKKVYQEGDQFIKFADKIHFKKLASLNQQEIFEIWQDFKRKCRYFAFWIVFPQTVDPYLENYLREKIIKPKIKNQKIDEDRVLFTVIKPDKKTFAEKEYEDFLKLVLWIKKNKLSFQNPEVKSKIEKHLFLYSWIQARWWQGKGVTEKELINRIKKTIPKIELLIKEQKEKEKSHKRELRYLKKILQFSEKEKKIIKIAQEVVFIRTYRTDILNLAGYRFRNFFEFLAKSVDLSYEEFLTLRVDEVEEIIKKKKISFKLKKEIERRKKYFVYFLIKGREKVFYQTKIEKVKIAVQEIKGRIAYPGYFKGKVVIVLNKAQFYKVRGGEILVTTMTSPEFMPVLKEVSAFITDEGGITCHAAIISRELKKPCIIGTKIATKVLKDGDLVEVDANKGVVRILKKQT